MMVLLRVVQIKMDSYLLPRRSRRAARGTLRVGDRLVGMR
jgi:hypothetical protein